MRSMVNSADFGVWSTPIIQGNSAGVSTIIVKSSVVTPQGLSFRPFATTAAITIGDAASSETVTPSAVDYTSRPGQCVISATFASAHGQGAMVSSGTQGQQEAINYVSANGGGQIYCVMQELITLSLLGPTTNSISNMYPGSSFIYGMGVEVIQTIAGNAVSLFSIGDENGNTVGVYHCTTLTAGSKAAWGGQFTQPTADVPSGIFSDTPFLATVTCDQTPTQGSLLVTVFSTITVP